MRIAADISRSFLILCRVSCFLLQGLLSIRWCQLPYCINWNLRCFPEICRLCPRYPPLWYAAHHIIKVFNANTPFLCFRSSPSRHPVRFIFKRISSHPDPTFCFLTHSDLIRRHLILSTQTIANPEYYYKSFLILDDVYAFRSTPVLIVCLLVSSVSSNFRAVLR